MLGLNRSLKSLEDLTIASNELAAQLLQLQSQEPVPEIPPVPEDTLTPVPIVPPLSTPVDTIVLESQKECANKFNINEIIFKVKDEFPTQLKNCSATLAKNMALAASPFGKKTELKEPKAFMMECTIDGIKQKLGGAAEYIKPVESFLQNIMNVASAASGSLDVTKLSSVISGLNVNDLINEIKTKAANDECAVDEPYSPPVALGSKDKEGSSSGEDDESMLSFGIRTGFNFSHLYAKMYGRSQGSYNSTPGFQLGLILDIAASEEFHFQPGLMYIQKGGEDNNGKAMTLSYIEIPLLLSLKLSTFRINTGPYFSIGTDAPSYIKAGFDIGFNVGFGFDIGMFYIGMSYEHSLVDGSVGDYELYNRTLGFNFGVNL